MPDEDVATPPGRVAEPGAGPAGDARAHDPLPSVEEIDRRLSRLALQPFRAKFHLQGRDRSTAELRGGRTMRKHAAEIVATRLAAADDVRTSRLLARVLRHAPGSVGLTLDTGGWVGVPALLDALAAHGTTVSRAHLERVVAGNDKQRFELDPGTDRVRARQGHSVGVDLGLEATLPPSALYHGTPERNLDAILREGLHRGARHHVHLSGDVETATRVGARRGRAVVLTVDAGAMARDGHRFYLTGNGVWLTDAVPAQYLRIG